LKVAAIDDVPLLLVFNGGYSILRCYSAQQRGWSGYGGLDDCDGGETSC
jgi:hypothetical protein